MARLSDPVVLNFLGGLNTAFRTSDVSASECVKGGNFDLDADFAGLNRRPSMDFINLRWQEAAAPLRGYAQLFKSDGSVSTLLQTSDGVVWEWNLASTATAVGSVDPSARLRGSKRSSFPLDDYVIITDLELRETVKQWDGTTFQDFSHNLGGQFKAKHVIVDRERAWFADVVTSGTHTPHVILGSALSDPTDLSNSDRPSSSRAVSDPFFLISPDLKPINAIERAFGQFVFSTDNGQLYILSGSDAQDFAVDDFYFGSAVSGNEALVSIGNDVVLGLPGRIELLSGVLQYGDVQSDDVSRWIRPSLKKIRGWRISYNQTTQRVYCIPDDRDEMWVLHKNVLFGGQEVSPWSKWTTAAGNSTTLSSAVIMTLLDANGRSETTYLGLDVNDGAGGYGLLSIAGGTGQDNGNAITMTWRSGLIRIPPADVFEVSGWINYRKLFAADLTLRLIFGGVASGTESMAISIPRTTAVAPVYGGTYYYNQTGVYYGSQFSAVISRQNFGPAARQASHFQIEVEYSGTADIQIEEIGVRFKTEDNTIGP